MTWAGSVGPITLVVEDLAGAKEFYLRAFGLPVHYEDDESCVFAFGTTLVNLLAASAAPELLAPGPVAAPGGARAVMTIQVEDVDAVCERLRAAGVELLNGPMDRPWGIRTASFRDPADHVWEIAH